MLEHVFRLNPIYSFFLLTIIRYRYLQYCVAYLVFEENYLYRL